MRHAASHTRVMRGVWVLVAGIVLLLSAGSVHAADVRFGTPEATATYGEFIVFTAPVTAGVPLARVELRVRYPATLGPAIIDVPIEPVSGS